MDDDNLDDQIRQQLQVLRRILRPSQTENLNDDQIDEEGPGDDTSSRPAGNGRPAGRHGEVHSTH